jgi:hypothetical protein
MFIRLHRRNVVIAVYSGAIVGAFAGADLCLMAPQGSPVELRSSVLSAQGNDGCGGGPTNLGGSGGPPPVTGGGGVCPDSSGAPEQSGPEIPPQPPVWGEQPPWIPLPGSEPYQRPLPGYYPYPGPDDLPPPPKSQPPPPFYYQPGPGF